MNRPYLRVALLSCLLALCALAATEEWRFEGTNDIFQITSDGKGGCAVTRITGVLGPAPTGDVLWFDRKGQLVYQGGISNLLGGGIAVCTRDNLVYGDVRDTNIVVHVNADGAATILPASAGTINHLPWRYFYNGSHVNDKKGYFVVVTETNANEVALVRYLYK